MEDYISKKVQDRR